LACGEFDGGECGEDYGCEDFCNRLHKCSFVDSFFFRTQI
jgi:hypothetical protein